MYVWQINMQSCHFLMSWPFNLWSRYSRRTLITWTKDRIREPKAKEPVWYLDRRRKQKANVSVKHFSPVPQTGYPTISHWPKGPTQGGKDGVGWNIFGLFESPIIWGESPRHCDLAQGCHKVGTPEEQENVVELEEDEVFVVEGLPAVEGKQALCTRALGGNIGRVECLQKSKEEVIDWGNFDAEVNKLFLKHF